MEISNNHLRKLAYKASLRVADLLRGTFFADGYVLPESYASETERIIKYVYEEFYTWHSGIMPINSSRVCVWYDFSRLHQVRIYISDQQVSIRLNEPKMAALSCGSLGSSEALTAISKFIYDLRGHL